MANRCGKPVARLEESVSSPLLRGRPNGAMTSGPRKLLHDPGHDAGNRQSSSRSCGRPNAGSPGEAMSPVRMATNPSRGRRQSAPGRVDEPPDSRGESTALLKRRQRSPVASCRRETRRLLFAPIITPHPPQCRSSPPGNREGDGSRFRPFHFRLGDFGFRICFRRARCYSGARRRWECPLAAAALA